MIFFWTISSLIVAMFLISVLTGAPYVPTHRKQVDEAFSNLRALSKSDTVLDIGSGDGVVLCSVLELGAGKAVGYEINPILVAISRLRTARFSNRCCIKLRNFWNSAFPDDITVVYTFGESRDIGKMYKKVQQEANRLNKDIDFISYAFEVPGYSYADRNKTHFLYKVSPLQ